MLLADEADGNYLAVAVGDRCAEDFLAHEYSFGMVAQCAVSEVGEESLGLVKPIVNGLIVFRLSAVLPGAALSMEVWVRHLRTSSYRIACQSCTIRDR